MSRAIASTMRTFWHRQANWECVISEIILSLMKTFPQQKAFQQHKLQPCQEPLWYCGPGMVSFLPNPSLPGHCSSLAFPGFLPQLEGRDFSNSKEDRGGVTSSPFPCFRKLDIQGQHSFSPGTILKHQNHHWQKAFLTCSLNFPFLAWVSCSWLYNHLLCNPVDFLSFCIPQTHVDINALLLILFMIY